MVHPPIVTAVATVLLGILYMRLTLTVTKLRRSSRASMGDGDGKGELAQAIRMHANFIEYTPFALILLGFAEMMGLWWPVIALGAASLVAGRLLHTRSWIGGKMVFKARVRGMLLTFGAYLIGIGGLALAIALRFVSV